MSAVLGSKRLTKEEGEFVGRLLIGRLAESLGRVLQVNVGTVADKLQYMNQYFADHSNEPAPVLSAEEFAAKIYTRFQAHFEESDGKEERVLQELYHELLSELGMEDLQCYRKT